MDYSSDLLSSMFLGRAEPFPDFAQLDEFAKDGHGDIFKDLPSGDVGFQPNLGQDDDLFPDWLDLKMDFSMLETSEVSDLVLDDLLLSEVGYEEVAAGQDLDVLPAPVMESKAPPPLDLEQLPYEQPLLASKQPPSPAELYVSSPSQTPPPSSPEWIVPDVGDSESPPSLFSPVPEVPSPSYSTISIPSPLAPAPTDGTVLTFVAPIVQPVSVIDTGEVIVEAQAVPLDNILSLSLLLGGVNATVQVSEPEPEQVQSENSLPPSPVVGRKKVKAATNRKTRAPKSRTPNESDSDDSVSAPATKKERKRKQNKDAAMRYRMKKRMETDTIADEETELMEENKKLREKAQHLSSELGYLKNLMREMFKARGLL